MGLLAIFAVAARNAVLLVRSSGVTHRPMRESVDRVVRDRAASIVLSALTMVAAVLPLLFLGRVAGTEALFPFAVVVIGGLVTSTLLALLVVPALYLRFSPGPSARTQSRGRRARRLAYRREGCDAALDWLAGHDRRSRRHSSSPVAPRGDRVNQLVTSLRPSRRSRAARSAKSPSPSEGASRIGLKTEPVRVLTTSGIRDVGPHSGPVGGGALRRTTASAGSTPARSRLPISGSGLSSTTWTATTPCFGPGRRRERSLSRWAVPSCSAPSMWSKANDWAAGRAADAHAMDRPLQPEVPIPRRGARCRADGARRVVHPEHAGRRLSGVRATTGRDPDGMSRPVDDRRRVARHGPVGAGAERDRGAPGPSVEISSAAVFHSDDLQAGHESATRPPARSGADGDCDAESADVGRATGDDAAGVGDRPRHEDRHELERSVRHRDVDDGLLDDPRSHHAGRGRRERRHVGRAAADDDQCSSTRSGCRRNRVTLDGVMEATADSVDSGLLRFSNGSIIGTGGAIELPAQRIGIRHVLPVVAPADLARVTVDNKSRRSGEPR